ncbi:NAD(P)/FAD-dependent oxidoreductase [Amnibacterium setariae]|jgi:NADH:ubiquinone reductase (H+-translocating)|uniref:Pyridine nucleotide-disulfide oxidoreductase n=1 Tax=Amnibacterium setariae TaxID=2306585 RepID=A0A3A1U3P4_9MICO|nr:FAD-dependent oxidoreductase [Amnibacterium setariae]RIX27614.1 pyridine nucleotide-disulfide oxidoreductase [Amnibacterium setariae]
MPVAPQKIVILGGGYVGLYVAWTLEKHSELPLEVTLIEPRAYMTYQPLLPEVAGGHVNPRDVTVDLRQALKHTNVVRGSVTGLDSKARTVTVAPVGGGEVVYDYDHAVVGLGAVTRTFPTPGLAEHGVGFKTVEEAAHTRNTVLLNVAKAAATSDPAERRKLLTFVFIGGGYTGVEALSELLVLSEKAIAAQPALKDEKPHWILIEALDRVAPEVGPELSQWTLGELRNRGVDIRLKTTMKSCEDAVAKFSDGDEVPFGMLVWTAGVKPNPVLDGTDLPRGPRGHVNTSPRLQVIREDGGWVRGVWAAGDNAQIPDLTKPQPAWYPPNAQNAVRQAVVLADNIARVVRRRRPRNYVHYSLGTVAEYGLFHGAANIYGVQLKELPAWLAHRGYHLFAMPTMDRKVRIFAGWVADFVGKPDLTPTDDFEDPTHDFRVAAGGK